MSKGSPTLTVSGPGGPISAALWATGAPHRGDGFVRLDLRDAEDRSLGFLTLFQPQVKERAPIIAGTSRRDDLHIDTCFTLRSLGIHGVGTQLIQAALRIADERAVPRVTVFARDGSAAFYARFGFVAEYPIEAQDELRRVMQQKPARWHGPALWMVLEGDPLREAISRAVR